MAVGTGVVELTTSRATNAAIRAEMARDPNVVCWGEDIAGGAGVDWFPEDEDAWPAVQPAFAGLRAEFGAARVRDMPICEAGFVGAAFGAASLGLRPVVDLWYPDFLGVCLDQVVNQGAKTPYMFGNQWTVPVVIRTLIGGGRSFGAQHSGCHYSVLAHYPGLKVVAPATPYDAKGLMSAAIRDDNPVVFCEHKLLASRKGEVPDEPYEIQIGKADLKRDGGDAVIVTMSAMVHTALRAAEQLASAGVEVAVLDLRTISPLDEDAILEQLGRSGRMVVLDEDLPHCGVASEVAALAAGRGFGELRAPVERVTAPHLPVPFSPPLEKRYIPDVDRTVAAVQRVLAH
jgi:pyruvate dehydrogenase E1 component beta subunit